MRMIAMVPGSRLSIGNAHRHAEIIKQLSAHNCLRLLNDMRQASLRLSTVDLYELPAWIEEAGVNRACKRALVVARDFNDYKFYETVSRNQATLMSRIEPPAFETGRRGRTRRKA
jgi:hypothetical protein